MFGKNLEANCSTLTMGKADSGSNSRKINLKINFSTLTVGKVDPGINSNYIEIVSIMKTTFKNIFLNIRYVDSSSFFDQLSIDIKM